MIRHADIWDIAATGAVRPIAPIQYAADHKSAQFKGHFYGTERKGEVGHFIARESAEGDLRLHLLD